MITNDIYINLLEVSPSVGDFNNVVARVHWEIVFTDGEYVSRGGGVTVLNTADIVDFIPTEQLTEAKVAEWVDQDLQAQAFKQQLIDYHTNAINDQKARATLVVWNQPLLETKVRPTESVLTIST